MSVRMDSNSTRSSVPSSSNVGAKKRGFSRLSFRRLFYSNPFFSQPHRFTARRKRSTPVADLDVANSDGASFSSHTIPTDVRQSAIKESYTSASNDSGPNQRGSRCDENFVHNQMIYRAGTSHGLECPLCLSELPFDCFPQISTCPHRSCYDCLKQYLRIEITESRVNISCPECTEPLHPTDIRMILNNDVLMEKYEDFMLRRVLVAEPDARWCPAPDCSFAVIAAGCASCPKLKCERPGCNTYFCYHCKQEWHPNQTCDAARAQRSPNIRSSSVSFSQESTIQRDDIKTCPRCRVLIVKMDDGSCNHMTCAVCGAEFCWLCMKEISDLHYLSPSGCTFWGKKPWSRKKKILWQLGTLVGAPVGIGLVAGIAVPAMIIGIPVWVGRKLHARFEHASKHKRNLAITGGVTASILVSPILAGLAVGIGVPILLAYVYGVVPISLCRSGGCGVTTSASGVRIEFDDENDLTMGAVGQGTGDAQSVDTSSHRVANPSIGEVSCGMSASLSMGSGSHLERVGLIRDSDRESASNTAIAGASLTGSIISSMTNAPTGHRLEVQADVASNKRFSFSSETASATMSLSERSATISVADDASTKALAGSMLSYRDRDNSSLSYTPVEIHMDPSVHIPLYIPLAHDETNAQLREDCPLGYTSNLKEDKPTFIQITNNDYLPKPTKQINLNIQDDNCSYRNVSGDDTLSEKVRFDENVSFIDDPTIDEIQSIPDGSNDGPSTSHSFMTSSTSWHEGVYHCSGALHGLSSGVLHAHTVEAVAEINLAAIGANKLPTMDRPVKSALIKRSSKLDSGAATVASDNLIASAHYTPGGATDCDMSQCCQDASQDRQTESSHLSLPASSDSDSYQTVSWATHQSLPCILDTEPTFQPVITEIKHV